MSSLSRLHTRSNKKRKAVSDVISTLLLIAVTVTAATLLFVMVNGTNLTKSIGGLSNQNLPPQLLLLGYDTRDNSGLSGITSLDNTMSASNTLRTISKTANNALPASGGTEYIILRIRNAGATAVNINSVTVNEVGHKWDDATNGKQFSLSTIGGSSSPGDGQFSVISTSNTSPIIQKSSFIPGSADVRLVIKLSAGINPDIPNGSIIRIVINVGNINAQTTFVIPAGSAK